MIQYSVSDRNLLNAFEVNQHTIKMQDISPTRLPPIDIHVKKMAREPPEKTWPKFKKVLIDYPRDTNLIYRQKLWEFQKMNRGAFRSHVTSLPEIPYRVNTNKPETVSIGIQSDMRIMHNQGLKFILPQISRTINNITEKLDVYLNSANDGTETGCSQCDDSDLDDAGFEFDSVKRRKNAGTMTEPFTQRKSNARQMKRPARKKKILKDKIVTPTERPSSRKMVKFEDENRKEIYLDMTNVQETENDIENETEEITEPRAEPENETDFVFGPVEKLEINNQVNRSASAASSSSTASSLSVDADNVGPTSHRGMDPVSVLDFLSGSRVSDARVMANDRMPDKQEVGRDLDETPRKPRRELYSERKWYQKIVGDKDLIDFGHYENFARVKPANDSCSDSNDKYVDLGKNTPRRSNNFTPRINNEFSPYKTQGRAGSNNQNVVSSMKKISDTQTKSRANSRRSMP